VLQIRFPRVLIAMMVGAALSVAGLVLQNISRNELADPYLTGVSSGAGLAVAIALWLKADLLYVPIFAFAGGLLVNAIAFAIGVPLMQRFCHVKMPLVTRRWYDIPLRASLVATLVATVVTLSGWVGPAISGILALFPVVFTSMMLILHPRIGGPPTAAVIANGAWGLMGFGLAVAVLHAAVLQFGSAIGLCLALATCVSWNLTLWWNGRRRAVPATK